MRVIVTGSRDWYMPGLIHLALADRLLRAVERGETLTVVHGGCPTGADAIAHSWAEGRNGVTVETFPADWNGEGRAAGPRRNQRMVAAGADECLAFIWQESRGASHCARTAEKAGIPVHLTASCAPRPPVEPTMPRVGL